MVPPTVHDGGAPRAPAVPAAILATGAAPHVDESRRRLGRWALAWAVGLTLCAALDGGVPHWTRQPDVEPRILAPLALAGAGPGAALGALLAFARRGALTPWVAAPVAAFLVAVLEAARIGQGGVGAPWAALWAAVAAAAVATMLGAVLARWRADVQRAGVRAVDHPLAGTLVLAAPLAWTWAARPATAVAAGLLGLAGAVVVGALRAGRGSAARGGARTTALLGAGTVLAALWPAWRPAVGAVAVSDIPSDAASAALGFASLVGAVGAGAAVLVARLAVGAASERRLERPALARAALPAALALAWGVRAPGGPLLAAALGTLLGYAAAEWRGRREEPLARAWHCTWPPVAVALLLLEAVRVGAGAGPTVPAALIEAGARLAVALGAARAGASLYHAQRDHVRALVAIGRGRGVRGAGRSPAAGARARAARATRARTATR